VCIPEQRRLPLVATLTIMNREELQIAAVIAWAIIWSVIAVSLVSSASSWILMVGLGALPPLVIVRMWHPLVRTVPAVIREVRK
jgi:hypothetical protein